MKVLAVCNRKGGAGKTTLAVGAAACLPGRVGLIDLDPNGSALRWMEGLDLFDVASGALETLPDDVEALSDDYEWLVIDTPPNDSRAIALSSKVADMTLIPLAPSPLEADQLPDTLALLDTSARYVLVPSRVRLSTNAGKAMRDFCDNAGHPVTMNVLTLSERIVQSFGQTPIRVAFRPLVDEIIKMVEQNP